MKRLMLNLLSLLFLIVFGGCEHRELVEPTEKHYVRVYLDEHIRNVHYGFYDETKKNMKAVLKDIQDGVFAGKWIAENKNGRTFLNAKRAQMARHPMEVVGAELRKNMLWGEDTNLDTASN